jgi:tight adherence protein B
MFGGALDSLLEGPVVAYLLFFAVGFLLVQTAFGLFGNAKMNQQLNSRLKARERAGSVQELLTELRQQRALNDDGELAWSSRFFNRLVTRSGIRFEPGKWAILSAVVSMAIGAVIFQFGGNLGYAAIASIILFFVLPVIALSKAGTKRSARLGSQLPDSLAVIVRSLEAGHPVPTAIALVGQEMPDPVGSEFGMVADEMAFGASLNDAVRRLSQRSFNEDVDLFAATIRLQTKTGGNLSELLKLNGDAIRDRQMLRLRVKAASAEGRMSALILSAAPFVVAGAVHLLNPDFYGDIIHRPVVQYWLAGFACWMMIGNLLMRKMIAFRI